MNYIKELTKEELKYICSVIPFQLACDYFKKNPKEFTKLRPGFRVKTLKEDTVVRTLFDFRNTDFIASFLTKVIDQWMDAISEELKKMIEKGLDQETAYIDVLSQSFFSGNVRLYFKIKSEEKSEEYLLVLSAAVNYQADRKKKKNDELSLLKKKGEETDKAVEDLNIKIADEEKKTERLRKNAADLKKILEEKNALIEREKAENARLSEDIRTLDVKLKKAEEEEARKAEEFIQKTALLIEQSEVYEKQLIDYKKRLEESEGVIKEYCSALASSKDGSESLRAINLDQKMQISDLRTENSKQEKTISELTAENEVLEELASQLREKNTFISIQNEEFRQMIQKLEESLKDAAQFSAHQNEEENEKRREVVHSMPLRPIDMDDFNDYFRYNLTNIGFIESEDGGMELIDYLEQTVFNGIPLLIKRGPGLNLANCLANTIYGKSVASVFTYRSGLGISDIEDFLLLTDERVVCLDGFFGNCNEVELLPVLDRHRNKIIILTYMYDKTLRYVPSEILSNVYYICMDEFSALMRGKDITEDPSEILEKESAYQMSPTDRRSRKIFMEIAQECGLERETASAMAELIVDETAMNRLLLFTLLPYVEKVIGVNPYNCSKRLQRYAGESGKCPNKEIIMRWFG